MPAVRGPATDSRKRKLWSRGALGALGTIVFLLATAFSAILHLGLPVARQAQRDALLAFLNGFFKGSFTIGQLSRLDAFGVRLSDVKIVDPYGRTVIAAESLALEFDLLGVGLRALRYYEKLSIVVDSARVSGATILLAPSPTNADAPVPSIADAFEPRIQSTSPTPPTEPGRSVRIWFADIELFEVSGRSELPTVPQGSFDVPSLKGRLLVGEEGVAIDVGQAEVKVREVLEETLELDGTASLRFPGALKFDVDVAAGEIQGHESIKYDEGKLTALGSFSDTPGEAVRRILPEWPLDGEIGLDHEVNGTLPLLDIHAKIRAGGGTSSAKGRLRISPELEADFDVDADSVDLSLLRDDWPGTKLGLRSAVELWGQAGRLAVTWNATLLPGEIAGQTTPAIDAAGNMDEHGTRGSLTFHERGLPLHITFSQSESEAIAFEARLKRARLQNSPRVQLLSPIRGTVEGTVTGTITPQRVLVRPFLDGTDLAVQGVELKNAQLRGAFEFDPSKIAEAYVDLSLTAQSLAVDRLEASDLTLAVEGPLQEPRVNFSGKTARGLSVHLTARTRTDKIEVKDLEATVRGDGPPIVLRLKHGLYDENGFELSKLLIESTGRLEADIRSGPPMVVRLRGENIDLARISRILALPEESMAGKVSASADLSIGKSSEGTLSFKVEQGAALGVTGISLGVDSNFEGQRVIGTSYGSIKDLGRGRASWDLELTQSPLSPNAFLKARGLATAEISEVQLDALSRLLGLESAIPGLGGQAQATLKLERNERSSLPAAHLSLETDELSFDLGNDGRLEQTDLTVYADVDPARERVSLAANIEDAIGALATASAELTLPLDAWATKFPNAADLEAIVLSAPIEAVYSVPERELRDLPLPRTTMPDLRGKVSARGVVRGAMNDPDISGSILVQNASFKASGLAKPISLEAKVQSQPKARSLTGQVVATQGRAQIASGSVDLTFPDGSEDGPSWLGQAQMIFDGMPTDLIVPLADTGVRGTLQGAVAASRKELLPQVSANLEIKNLSAAGKRVGEGTLELRNNGDRVNAALHVEDEFGSLEAYLEGALRGTRHFLEPSPGTPLAVRVNAKRFNAAVLSPIFDGILDDFNGSLSGEASADLRAPTGDEEWKARISGHLSLDDGEMTPTSMRLKLTGVKMSLSARPEGAYNLIEIKDLRAKARSAEENFQAQGALYFDNLTWVGGRISFSQTRVPILSEGAELVTLTGKGEIDFEKGEDELRVKLDVPELEAELPNSSDHDLIALRENETIHVTIASKDVFAKPESNGSSQRIVVSVHLGDRVRVKSSIASLKLKGDPVLYYDDKMTMNGSIALVPGGRIQVMGRVFIIEHGSIYFDDSDVSNPLIEITAAWRASDGVLIRASLSGRARSPKLEWSSDPPIAGGETAVVSRVLGGSSNGSASNAGLAYGAAALNELLGQSGVRGVELSAQSESGQQGQMARLSERTRDSYSAAFQVSENVWFEGKYTQEFAGPGTTARNGFSGTIDWRFSPQWSARSEIGTLGTGLDLLWQYRY